jgi:hypothetical protein
MMQSVVMISDNLVKDNVQWCENIVLTTSYQVSASRNMLTVDQRKISLWQL